MVVDFACIVIPEILYLLYSDNYTNYTVIRHFGTNPKSIRNYDRYGIRPCGKTPLDATLRLVEFQINKFLHS